MLCRHHKRQKQSLYLWKGQKVGINVFLTVHIEKTLGRGSSLRKRFQSTWPGIRLMLEPHILHIYGFNADSNASQRWPTRDLRTPRPRKIWEERRTEESTWYNSGHESTCLWLFTRLLWNRYDDTYSGWMSSLGLHGWKMARDGQVWEWYFFLNTGITFSTQQVVLLALGWGAWGWLGLEAVVAAAAGPVLWTNRGLCSFWENKNTTKEKLNNMANIWKLVCKS